MGAQDWRLIASLSFEDRCTALAEWVAAMPALLSSAVAFRIKNPPSMSWDQAVPRIAANEDILVRHLAGVPTEIRDISLLDYPSSAMNGDALFGLGGESVLLDVTTLPKRFFLFAVKRLIEDARVKNLVVCYSHAERYPEIPLCGDALPPTAMQGFGRVEERRDQHKMIVGVGYVALSVDQLLASTHSQIDFIFPFPPASPAFRRNWKLLSLLMPTDLPATTQIHRVDGTDAFEVCAKLVSIGREADLDLIPLGPKPHALGMAMACLKLAGRAEIIYSQPRTYDVNYSTGISRDTSGRANIIAYCLKRNGSQTF